MLPKPLANVLLREDMQELFDPVVKKIIGLLEQQIVATRSESSLIINVSILNLFLEAHWSLSQLM